MSNELLFLIQNKYLKLKCNVSMNIQGSLKSNISMNIQGSLIWFSRKIFIMKKNYLE